MTSNSTCILKNLSMTVIKDRTEVIRHKTTAMIVLLRSFVRLLISVQAEIFSPVL